MQLKSGGDVDNIRFARRQGNGYDVKPQRHVQQPMSLGVLQAESPDFLLFAVVDGLCSGTETGASLCTHFHNDETRFVRRDGHNVQLSDT